jgi:hypothetical protein
MEIPHVLIMWRDLEVEEEAKHETHLIYIILEVHPNSVLET